MTIVMCFDRIILNFVLHFSRDSLGKSAMEGKLCLSPRGYAFIYTRR